MQYVPESILRKTAQISTLIDLSSSIASVQILRKPLNFSNKAKNSMNDIMSAITATAEMIEILTVHVMIQVEIETSSPTRDSISMTTNNPTNIRTGAIMLRNRLTYSQRATRNTKTIKYRKQIKMIAIMVTILELT